MSYWHNCWIEPEIWPRDTGDFIFVARAILNIGRAKYGPDFDYTSLRFRGVCAAMLDAAIDGQAIMASRSISGGDLPRQIERVIFNTEHYDHWFRSGKIDLMHPMRPGSRPPLVTDFRWLFVSRQFVQPNANQAQTQAQNETVSDRRPTKRFAEADVLTGYKKFGADNPMATREKWLLFASEIFDASSTAARRIWTEQRPLGGRKAGRKPTHH